jgi:hypothetical protein
MMTERRSDNDDESLEPMAPQLPVGVMLHRLRMINALNEFPSLKKIVDGNRNLMSPIAPPMVPTDNRQFTLSDLLYVVDELLPWYRMLNTLDTWLEHYPDYQTRAFGKQLISDFFARYVEIEFYHYLRENGIAPGLNPKVAANEQKNVDFDIQFNGRPFLIEVFLPHHSQELEAEFEAGSAGFFDPERGIGPKNQRQYSRVATPIAREIMHHFNGVDPSVVAAPVVLAMNITYAYPEVMMGESLPSDVALPQFIAGVLLYDTRRKQARFYPNQVAGLDSETIEFFSELIPRAWEQIETKCG